MYLLDSRSSCRELRVSTPAGSVDDTGLAANLSRTSIPFSSATYTSVNMTFYDFHLKIL